MDWFLLFFSQRFLLGYLISYVSVCSEEGEGISWVTPIDPVLYDQPSNALPGYGIGPEIAESVKQVPSLSTWSSTSRLVSFEFDDFFLLYSLLHLSFHRVIPSCLNWSGLTNSVEKFVMGAFVFARDGIRFDCFNRAKVHDLSDPKYFKLSLLMTISGRSME